jgi:putative glycosyltransferase (TIGR04372 family)
MRRQLRASHGEFVSGDFVRAGATLVLAGETQRQARLRSGLDALNLRVFGSEILNAFGHLAVGPEIRAKASHLGLTSERYLLIRTPGEANSALAAYWTSAFPALQLSERDGSKLERAIWPIVESVQWFDDGQSCRHLYQAYSDVQISWEASGLGSALSLTDEHQDRGRRALATMGVPVNGWFAAMHVRASHEGSAYGRNAIASSYARAVRRVNEAGGNVVQIGGSGSLESVVPGAISIVQARHQQPWLDLYVLGAARFLIGTQSGPSSVASAFGTPVLLTNITGWGFLPNLSGTWAIPKLVRRKGTDQEPLPLKELVRLGLGCSDSYLPRGIDGIEYEWVANNPDDIVAGIDEMLAGQGAHPKDRIDESLDHLHSSLVGYPGVRLTAASKHHLV